MHTTWYEVVLAAALLGLAPGLDWLLSKSALRHVGSLRVPLRGVTVGIPALLLPAVISLVEPGAGRWILFPGLATSLVLAYRARRWLTPPEVRAAEEEDDVAHDEERAALEYHASEPRVDPLSDTELGEVLERIRVQTRHRLLAAGGAGVAIVTWGLLRPPELVVWRVMLALVAVVVVGLLIARSGLLKDVTRAKLQLLAGGPLLPRDKRWLEELRRSAYWVHKVRRGRV